MSSFLCFLYFSTFFFSSAVLICLARFLSFSQTLPSSTSSTARPLRTSRSCVRPAQMSYLCVKKILRPLLPHLLLHGDLFLLYPLSTTPTLSHTQAPSPVSKACLSLSPQNVQAGLPPHGSPSLSHSHPHCGGSCQRSGTVPNLRSSQKTRGDYKR